MPDLPITRYPVEPKLCPFCTSCDLRVVNFVECLSCGARGPDVLTRDDTEALPHDLRKRALEAWNDRCVCNPAERTGGDHDPKCPHYDPMHGCEPPER